jgi:hypothetical protein
MTRRLQPIFVCRFSISADTSPMSVDYLQSRSGALRYGLLHPLAVGLRSLIVVDQHDAVVLHLEHVLGDRFADAVPRALIEIDFNPHDGSY